MDKATPAKVRDLWANAYYRDIVGEIEKLAPIVPDYSPDDNNVETMKFESARKQMHALVMKVIKPKES